jgi:hypothetical protein
VNATFITLETPDVAYGNLVVHECSIRDFIQDIRREALKCREEGMVGKIDIYWHLDEYCKAKYGPCPWHTISLETLGKITDLDDKKPSK